MGFNLDDYEPVADRIERFWKDHKDGRILTELIHRDEQRFIVKASIYRFEADADTLPGSTGYAEEIIGSTNVNRTSALENCETSAIGRALANLGYAVKNRASREEMQKVQPEPRPRSGMKRTPTPDSSESHKTAPETNGKPDQAVAIARMKNELLTRTGGNKELAKDAWWETLIFFGLNPTDPVPGDMLESIEAHIKTRAAS